MRHLAIALSIFCLPAAASAQMEAMKLASDLGSLIGSETFCGLSYNQAAIAAYIDAKAPKGDLGFAQNMSIMATGAEFMTQSMSPSAKTAHCAAITNSARHFGFIN